MDYTNGGNPLQSNYLLKGFETVSTGVEPISSPPSTSSSKTFLRSGSVILHHHPAALKLFFKDLLPLYIRLIILVSRGVHKLNRTKMIDRTKPKNRIFFGFYTYNGLIWSISFNGPFLFGPVFGPGNKNCKKKEPVQYIYIL